MDVTLYQSRIQSSSPLNEYLNAYFAQQMPYLASDFLKKGFSPEDISEAVQRAMTICRTAGMDVRRHFQLIYTQYKNGIVQDCKLSRVGFGLVLLNGRADEKVVAKWQLEVLEKVI